MPIREFKCDSCQTLTEKICLTAEENALTEIRCPRCGSKAALKEFPSRIAVSREGSPNAPVDIIIGADANRRWSDIKEKQAIRNKVRVDTNTPGLTKVGPTEYVPISDQQKLLRTEVLDSLVRSTSSTEPK